MRSLLVGCVLVASSALAHIKLSVPPSFQVTDALGSPNKAAPCGGPGTATNTVTTVEAGSQLTVTWLEPILHPGHFRIGIATNPADFVTPVPVLTGNGTNCSTAPIASSPAYPTIADGVFVHTAASPTGSWTTTVTVPMVSCENCVLQLMQFMSSHGPPCFYYQCATLRIVMPDAGQPVVDAGIVDAGQPAVDAGTDAGMSGSGGGGGSSPPACGPATCAGCCGFDGRCQGGITPAACGAGGLSCETCSGQNPCEAGQCAAPRGCGCTSAPLALLVFFPLLLLRRRVAAR